MGMKRNYLGALGMFAALSASTEIYGTPQTFKKKDPEKMNKKEFKEYKSSVDKQREIKRVERLKKRGCKQFFYGDNYIMAINQKTADKKANKKGYLK